jgi:hypothetical protein
VTREPEWDDLQRTRMLALAEYHAGVHEGCGLHQSIADEDPDFSIEDHVCPVCAGIAPWLRERTAQELEDEKDLEPGERRKSDGRTPLIRLGPRRTT